VLARHADDQVLIIGQYLDQLAAVAQRLAAPLITGKTPTLEREELYEAFRAGRIHLLVVSKVANFSIDLPEASVAIQISGTFGSRQEEAQRLGRILRPKRSGLSAHFYSLVTRDTRDQDFAANRQLFLTEQGYRYEILSPHDLIASRPAPGATTAKPTADPASAAIRSSRPSSTGRRQSRRSSPLSSSILGNDEMRAGSGNQHPADR
jgi:DNA excision repair protein ERCC-3